MAERTVLRCSICGGPIDEGEALYIDDTIDYAGFTAIDEDLLGGLLCPGCAEELSEFGSTMRYYGPEGSFSVKFIDFTVKDTGKRTVIYHYVEDVDPEDRIGDIVKLLEAIMRTYTWQPSSPYTGAYQPREGQVQVDGTTWVRAIRAWAAIGAEGKPVEVINELIRLAKAGALDFPIIVAYPRSSNVAVAYLDIWVRERDRSKLQKMIPEGFSLSEGYSVQVL